MTDWRSKAQCKGMDPDLMVPGRGAPRVDVDAAKAACVGCPVQAPCLEDALRTRAPGVRGGLSGAERKALSESRKLVDA